MCGVARDTSGDSDIVPPLEAAMPPSITVGSDPPKPAAGPGDHMGQQEPSAATRDITIDLSCDENGDLQKAIALSLQEQQSSSSLQGVSAEDQEVSRALEASLKDSQPQATIDLHNPWERRRQPSIPVGLKNIGNSCWFNGVIQPLFHIPAFRDLILNFPQNVEVEEDMEEPEKSPRHLVPVLRKLFSLMIGSKRKYIDPTPAVHIFQGQEMRKNAQQDVCEFIHKLLEKLEEEFHQLLRCQGVEKESSGCHVSKDADFDNPIMKLFYGQSKKEISNGDGDEELKQEAFGQNILHIMNYEHIHDSILASLASTMPGTHGEVVQPVKQEIWFKMLPPVLIYSLSRYEFSHEKKRAEKVHNKFEFPEFLYMDRYMEINKKVIREKHILVAKLQGELNSLTNTLDRYLKYGSGEAKYPISDILKYTLDFAQTGLNASSEPEADGIPSPSMMEVDGVEGAEDDVEMADAADVKKAGDEVGEKESKAQVNEQVVPSDSQTKEKTTKGGDTEKMEEEAAGQVPVQEEGAKAAEEEPRQMPSPSKKMRILPPAPRTITTSELPVLQSCLSRWLQDINAQVAQLRHCIAEIEQQLDKMYDEPFLKRIPYHLHAVVVHQGQASGGHYWVYTFDKTRNVWMKFNDIQVVESTWDDLLQDSLGGQNNASAYCLFYVDESRYNSLFPVVPKSTEALMDSLAIDLQEYVKNDNMAFDRELEEWNAKQQGAAEQGKEVAVWPIPETDAAGCNKKRITVVPSTAPNSPDIVLQDSEEASFFTEIRTILSETVLDDLTKKDENALQKDQGLFGILRREFVRLQSFADTPADEKYSEPSILDFGVYLIRNNTNVDILLHWYGCVVVLQVVQIISEHTPILDQVALEASRHLQQLQQLEPPHDSEYLGWFKHYRDFIYCTWSLVFGYKQYDKGRYERALPHLLQACRIHQELKDRSPDGPRKTIDKQVLWKCRETCLLKLNKKLVDTFKDGEEDQIGEIPGHIKTLVVPALTQLISSGWEEDMATVEQVRNHWCNLLGCTASAKSEMLCSIIQIVFGENKGNIPLRIPQPPTVLALYEQYKETCCSVMSSTSKTRAQTSEL